MKDIDNLQKKDITYIRRVRENCFTLAGKIFEIFSHKGHKGHKEHGEREGKAWILPQNSGLYPIA